MQQYPGPGNVHPGGQPPYPQQFAQQQYGAQPVYGTPHNYGPPHGYGSPTGQPISQPPTGTAATGKILFTACWSMLKQDKQLLWLPAIGFVAAVIAAAILFVPGFFLGDGIGGDESGTRFGIYVGGVLAAFAASFVSIYFQAALIIGANMRADGQQPTVGNTLRAAGRIAGKILAWAAVTTIVGTAIRAIEQRFGLIGRILGIVAGIAWAIASYLVLPVIVVEGLGPIDAVKRSSQLLKQTWGTGLRTNVRAGLIQLGLMVIPIVGLVAGVVLLAGAPVLGVPLLAISLAALLAIGLVFGAINGYARTLIYRYATGRPVPLAPALVSVAFTAKQPAYAMTGPSPYYRQY